MPSEQREGNHEWSGETGVPDRLEVQPGVRYLVAEKGKQPRLLARRPKRGDDLFLLEHVYQNRVPYLAVARAGKRHALVNGRPAPSLVLLAEKDEVVFNELAGYVAHVTVFNDLSVGPPSENEIGKECSFCRTEFDSDTTIYTCHVCGNLLHLEGEEKPEKERLECALLCHACPSCKTPILREQGYSYFPEISDPL